MNISSTPHDYQGAYGSPEFTIDSADPDQTLEVAIVAGDGQTVGYKRLSGETSYRVHPGGYIGDQFEIEPTNKEGLCITKMAGRSAEVSIVANGVSSEKYMLTAGVVDSVPLTLLTDAPQKRAIATGEAEELSFFAPNKELEVEIVFVGKQIFSGWTIMNIPKSRHMFSVQIDMSEIETVLEDNEQGLSESLRAIYVELYADNKIFALMEYRITQATENDVRLAWVNKYGAVDYYTFCDVGGSMNATTRSRIESANGKSMFVAAQESTELISRYETMESLRWLSGIISAPKVWVVKNGVATTVFIDSNSIKYTEGKTRRLSLSIVSQITKSQNL